MKKRIIITALAMCILLTLAPALSIGTALAEELESLFIDFEDGELGGFLSEDEGAYLAVTNEESHSGENALKLQSGWGGAYLRFDQIIKPNHAYEITMWIRSASDRPVSPLLRVRLHPDNYDPVTDTYRHSDQIDIAGWFLHINYADGWIKLTNVMNFDTTRPLDYVDILINCWNDNSDMSSEVFYIDDVSIREIGPSGLETSARLPSLHEAYEEYFKIGNWNGTVGIDHSNQAFFWSITPMILRHYNTYSIVIHPYMYNQQGYDFIEPDIVVQKNSVDGLSLRMFTLIHHHMPNWLYEKNDSIPMTRQEAIQSMTDYINTVAGRYSDNVNSWFVINEGISGFGTFDDFYERGNNWCDVVEQNGWYRAFANGADESKGESGADYIETAFRLARQAAPDVQLIFNDFCFYDPLKADIVADMVKEINDRWLAEGNTRLLIECIGMQGHYYSGMPNEYNHDDIVSNPTDPANVEYAIKRFIDLGEKISVTELDVSLYGWWEKLDVWPDVEKLLPTEDRLERQAELYARMFQIYKKYSAHITDVTFMEMEDDVSLGYENDLHTPIYPNIFDTSFNPKLAYFAVVDPEGYLAGDYDTVEKREAWIAANSLPEPTPEPEPEPEPEPPTEPPTQATPTPATPEPTATPQRETPTVTDSGGDMTWLWITLSVGGAAVIAVVVLVVVRKKK